MKQLVNVCVQGQALQSILRAFDVTDVPTWLECARPEINRDSLTRKGSPSIKEQIINFGHVLYERITVIREGQRYQALSRQPTVHVAEYNPIHEWFARRGSCEDHRSVSV